MAEKLTLVVTCTERKSVPPTDRLRFRNQASAPLPQQVARWREAVRREVPRNPLRKLYQGDAWTQALKLEASARRAGFAPELLVASAGLGLVSADAECPAYAATFSPRQADSISSKSNEVQIWWDLLTSGQQSRKRMTGQTIFVLSKNYATAMAADFSHLEKRDDVVVFGGSSDIPDRLRIPADVGLRRVLGGTATSLNIRTAIAWLELLEAPSIVGQQENRAWDKWVKSNSAPVSWDRRPLSDMQVFEFLQNVRRTEPSVSKTRALRILRDSGMACEQKRFGELFQQSTAATS